MEGLPQETPKTCFGCVLLRRKDLFLSYPSHAILLRGVPLSFFRLSPFACGELFLSEPYSLISISTPAGRSSFVSASVVLAVALVMSISLL